MYYHMSLHIIGFFNMISTTTADGHKIVSHIYWILWIPQHIQISPDVDEFLLVYMLATTLALHWLHSHLFHPFYAGSGHGVPYNGLHVWNQVLGPGKHHWANRQGSRMCTAPILAWHRKCLFIAQVCREGHSMWLLPDMTYYCLLLCINNLQAPQQKISAWGWWCSLSTFCAEVYNMGEYVIMLTHYYIITIHILQHSNRFSLFLKFSNRFSITTISIM